MSMAAGSEISASSLQSVTGYCLAHQYITIIHFWRERRDLEKKLPSLMDLVPLHREQYQQMPSLISRLALSRMVVPHLEEAPAN